MRENKKAASSKQIYQAIKNIAINEGKVVNEAAWSSAYRHAWNNNLIVRMTTEARSVYKTSIIESLESKKRGGLLPGTFNIDDSIQIECHKRIMQVHFQEMIDKNQAV